MQNLPVIIAVFLATAAIIAVLFWRINPQSHTNSEVADKRVAEEVEKARTLQAKLDANETALRDALVAASAAKVSVEAANTRASAAETSAQQAKADLTDLYSKYNVATEQAATAKADVEHKRMQIDGMSRSIEALDCNLTEERAKLNHALAKQQSDGDAARHFENISQTILKDVLEEAKRGVGELAATLQKSSGDELARHAQSVARTLEPLQAKLQAYDAAVDNFQKGSQENYGSLKEQLTRLQETEHSLHKQAEALTAALSDNPKHRGNYGELALKRLVESVGMQERCHFQEQASRDTEEGRKIPDMVIFLPGGQKVIVDAKAVLNASVQAHEVQDETQRSILLKRHCDNVKGRVSELSSKNYFADYTGAVETVILFLPAENLYITAMQHDPQLTEYAASRKVIICGPSSLIMLLTVANQLWRQASIEKEVQDIKKCGEDIFKAACGFTEKFVGIGKKIQSLENEYNDAVATLEGRLLPAGKRMSKFEAVARNQELSDVAPVKDNVRELREATQRLIASTQKLPGLVVGDETSEFSFSSGDE